MTVCPGLGQRYRDDVEKVSALRAYGNAQGLELDIQVDGGSTAYRAPAAAAGATCWLRVLPSLARRTVRRRFAGFGRLRRFSRAGRGH
ncbi:MAG: hypothetical protein ACLSAP_06325 [Oscillospiraceae bacterium]